MTKYTFYMRSRMLGMITNHVILSRHDVRHACPPSSDTYLPTFPQITIPHRFPLGNSCQISCSTNTGIGLTLCQARFKIIILSVHVYSIVAKFLKATSGTHMVERCPPPPPPPPPSKNIITTPYMNIITLHIIITIRHLLVPLSIHVCFKVVSETMSNAEVGRSKHGPPNCFVEYLKTPPSTNGISSLASLLQVRTYTLTGSYSPQLDHLQQLSLFAACGLSLISVPRLQQAWAREQGYCYMDKSTFHTGQGTRQRILGLSWTFQDTWQL